MQILRGKKLVTFGNLWGALWDPLNMKVLQVKMEINQIMQLKKLLPQ